MTVTESAEFQRVAFNLGWDYRKHGLVLPDDVPEDMHEGWKAAASKVSRKPDRYILKFLYIRYSALKRHRVVSTHVTPELIQYLDNSGICPITRRSLTYGTLTDSDWSIDRVNNDGGYAPGNLVVMSAKANKAKGSKSADDIDELIHVMKIKGESIYEGLTINEWKRMLWLTEKCGGDRPVPFTLEPPPLIGTNNFDTLQWFLPLSCFVPKVRKTFDVKTLCLNKVARKKLIKYIKAAEPIILNENRTRNNMVDAFYDIYLVDSVYERFVEFLIDIYELGTDRLLLKAAKAFTKRLVKEDGKDVDEYSQYSQVNLERTWSMESRGYMTGTEEPRDDEDIVKFLNLYLEKTK